MIISGICIVLKLFRYKQHACKQKYRLNLQTFALYLYIVTMYTWLWSADRQVQLFTNLTIGCNSGRSIEYRLCDILQNRFLFPYCATINNGPEMCNSHMLNACNTYSYVACSTWNLTIFYVSFKRTYNSSIRRSLKFIFVFLTTNLYDQDQSDFYGDYIFNLT